MLSENGNKCQYKLGPTIGLLFQATAFRPNWAYRPAGNQNKGRYVDHKQQIQQLATAVTGNICYRQQLEQQATAATGNSCSSSRQPA